MFLPLAARARLLDVGPALAPLQGKTVLGRESNDVCAAVTMPRRWRDTGRDCRASPVRLTGPHLVIGIESWFPVSRICRAVPQMNSIGGSSHRACMVPLRNRPYWRSRDQTRPRRPCPHMRTTALEQRSPRHRTPLVVVLARESLLPGPRVRGISHRNPTGTGADASGPGVDSRPTARRFVHSNQAGA